MRRLLAVAVALVLLAALPASATPTASAADGRDRASSGADAGRAVFPTRIPLPDGFFPEGIAIDGLTAFVGSLVDGAIVQQDLLRGRTSSFAPSPGPNRIAVGLDVDRHGRLWVAGGGPMMGFPVTPGFRVYDTRTGELLVEQEVQAGFLNDVIVTRDAAWFTDSFTAQLIRVPLGDDGAIGEPRAVTLGGDWTQVPGQFGANGIVATRSGRTLVVAQSASPEDPDAAALYRVPADVSADVLDADRIELDQPLAGADGLVLVGRTLYSVAGPDGVVELRLRFDLRRGRVVDTLTVPGAVTPTTADVFGPRLYVVDANFPAFGDPTTPFETVAIRR